MARHISLVLSQQHQLERRLALPFAREVQL
jgi:hypothetical protein